MIFLFPVWEHANGQVNGLQSEDQVPMMSNGGNNEHETSSPRYICATYRICNSILIPLTPHKFVSHTHLHLCGACYHEMGD